MTSKKNILNFDQVPRYFEQENNRTIALKGSKNVKVAKAGSSHSRFTFTPIINAEGDFLETHCLFSKLKKIPSGTNEKVRVDVNQTGMWSENLVHSFIVKYILSRPETTFAKEPILLIIDSFSAHLKVAKRYEKFNVYISFVPPGMTPFLQMLDVSINRSFQQFYGDEINEWIKKAIGNEENRTKAGNIKRPSYKHVTDICHAFTEKVSPDMIKKSFEICGITGDILEIEKLHDPLRKLLLDENVSPLEYISGLNEEEIQEMTKAIDIIGWETYGHRENSLFCLMSKVIFDCIEFQKQVRISVVQVLRENAVFLDLCDEKYLYDMENNNKSASEYEVYAMSVFYDIKINLYNDPNSFQPFYVYNKDVDDEYSTFDILEYGGIFYLRKKEI